MVSVLSVTVVVATGDIEDDIVCSADLELDAGVWVDIGDIIEESEVKPPLPPGTVSPPTAPPAGAVAVGVFKMVRSSVRTISTEPACP